MGLGAEVVQTRCERLLPREVQARCPEISPRSGTFWLLVCSEDVKSASNSRNWSATATESLIVSQNEMWICR